MKQKLKQFIGRQYNVINRFLSNRDRFHIFTFHRVLSDTQYSETRFERNIAISESAFRTFLTDLAEDFQIVSLAEAIEHQFINPSRHQKPFACITFDDGWSDNFHIAFPILKALNLPATIFLATDYIDSDKGFWWQHVGELLTSNTLTNHQQDELHHYLMNKLNIQTVNKQNSLKPSNTHSEQTYVHSADEIIQRIKTQFHDAIDDILSEMNRISGTDYEAHGLTWDQCREMANHNITFGSHTKSHAELTQLLPAELRDQLQGSKQIILNQLGEHYVNAICYPYGFYNGEILKASKNIYSAGFSTLLGTYKENLNKMAIPRINATQDISLSRDLFYYRLIKASFK